MEQSKGRFMVWLFLGFNTKCVSEFFQKLRKWGPLPIEKAVTVEEAGLDLQEQAWLNFFAGAFLGKIKKTEDHRYYV